MKALIFNSGIGSRMGSLTKSCPKCLLKLADGESVFARQLRILAQSGITEIIVTTGKYAHELMEEGRTQPTLNITFVYNPLWDSTNYIYSMYLAGKYLDDDILMMHGDLVFDSALVREILSEKSPSLCLINKHISQPPKDFKGRVENDYLKEVSIHIFDDNCYALQPLYKLSKECVQSWLAEVRMFVESGITNVYAENALNKIADKLDIKVMSYENHYINEIDTPEDYCRVSREIWMADSGTYFSINSLEMLVKKHKAQRPFAIMGRHIADSAVEKLLDKIQVKVGRYFGVMENPSEESVAAAQRAFEEFEGDLLISIGGGSAIDTAKAVKYKLLDSQGYNNPAHIAVPTTAGSGSEATHFAVVYRDGVKCSVTDATLLPENVILDSALLYSLSEQQQKVSLLDALCHGIESLISRNSTAESREYAIYSIKMILEKYKSYVSGNKTVYKDIFAASNYAGRAINISKTTVGHAMSYVLTSDYGISHGQAVALCLISVLRYAEKQYRRKEELNSVCTALGCKEGQSAADRLLEVYRNMHLQNPFDLSDAIPEILAQKVNAERLANSVVIFDEKDLGEIYADVIALAYTLKNEV